MTDSNNDVPTEGFMIDPSLLFIDSAMDWLESIDYSHELVFVSDSFVATLEESPISPYSPFVPAGHATDLDTKQARALAFVSGTSRFSWQSVDLGDGDRPVLGALLERGLPEFTVFADEWAYLQSQSILFSALRHSIEAFRDAGAVIVEYGRKLLTEFVEAAIPQKSLASDKYGPTELYLRSGVKWIAWGGAIAGGFVMGGPGGAVVGGVSQPFIRAIDP